MHDSSFGYLFSAYIIIFYSSITVCLSTQRYMPSDGCSHAGLDKDCRLTEPLGMRIAEFPLNPMFAKMLLESGGWRPTVLIDFILSVRGVFSLKSMHLGEEGSIYSGE